MQLSPSGRIPNQRGWGCVIFVASSPRCVGICHQHSIVSIVAWWTQTTSDLLQWPERRHICHSPSVWRWSNAYLYDAPSTPCTSTLPIEPNAWGVRCTGGIWRFSAYGMIYSMPCPWNHYALCSSNMNSFWKSSNAINASCMVWNVVSSMQQLTFHGKNYWTQVIESAAKCNNQPARS